MAPSARNLISSKKVKPKPVSVTGSPTVLRSTIVSPPSQTSYLDHRRNPVKSVKVQQLLLDLLKNAFAIRSNDQLHETIQRIKKHLYHRDFDQAFSEEALREAYAIRWSSSRALAYLDICHELPAIGNHLLRNNQSVLETSPPDVTSPSRKCSSIEAHTTSREDANRASADLISDVARVVCIGGGAGAEIVALAGYLHEATEGAQENSETGDQDRSISTHLDITAVDVADWSSTLNKIHTALTTPTAKASNTALIHAGHLTIHFLHQNILTLQPIALKSLFQNTALTTLLFTLNELYTTSISQTTTFLLSLTSALPPGALFLVVDSPGSYSTVALNADSSQAKEKRYPMQWLLDHTLLEVTSTRNDHGSTSQHKKWEKIHENTSRWFRLARELTYPMGLEDMRCQVHLYRKLAS